MEKIDFYVDRKVTMWVREYHTVDTDMFTPDELSEYLKGIVAANSNIDYELESFQYQEYLFETSEPMSPFENDNQPTLEVYIGDDCIVTNTDKNI